MTNLHEQIKWVEGQIKSMAQHLPTAVQQRRVSSEQATHKVECAQSVLNTLTSLRDAGAKP